ncbi:hypothetical protein ENSA5_17880 [Enhygromyxa salina]|uniref:Uncharacterized protein n=1 Tax=Enhygromyxa salina TaxID=215803 RepID=A0A2S9YDQ6_9BACT|nr:hypothetical protein [Enhygromyxa salina]PRQ03244.1 hypothetical protein ENSA5_17880 [Enhygromyxa salina]
MSSKIKQLHSGVCPARACAPTPSLRSGPRSCKAVVKALSVFGLGLGLLGASGCASFKLKDPPPGFIEVSSSHWGGEGELRMKAPDNVGLNITTFSNRKGGTLAIWADDLVSKLAERHYVLQRQEAVKSGNGVQGTRFDFAYAPPSSEDDEKFFTVVLFVTDEWRVVVQLAGDKGLASAHGEDLDRILGDIKIRGCKAGSKVCKSGQPPQFDTTQQPRPDGPGPQAADKPAEGEQPGGADQPKGGEAPGDADEPAEGDKPAAGDKAS